MSFEGYYQCLCEKGHQFMRGLYDDDNKCPTCAERKAEEDRLDREANERRAFFLWTDRIERGLKP